MGYYETEMVNPTVVGIAVFVILFLLLVLIYIYIPRIDEITRLQKENEKLKKRCSKLSEELSSELLAKHYIYSEYEDLLSQKDGRIKQADKKAETFAVLCDKYKNGYSKEV